MVTWDDGFRLNLRKGNGLVREVFEEHHMRRLRGTMGIGHVRYPTAGTASAAEAQPMYVNSPYGISLGHNGNLTNARRLEADVFRAGTAPRQHRLGLGGAAQRLRPRASEDRRLRAIAGTHLPGHCPVFTAGVGVPMRWWP